MYCDLVHCQYNAGQGCEITQVKVATKAIFCSHILSLFLANTTSYLFDYGLF